MAGNGDPPPGHPDWGVVVHSIANPRESNLTVDHGQCQVPGLSTFGHDDIDRIRRTVGHARWLGVVIAEASKALSSTNAIKSNLQAAQKDARLLLVNEELSEENEPFQMLTPRSSSRTIGSALSVDTAHTCGSTWGPNPGITRDLLSPSIMTVLCWLGPKYAAPLLDFIYAFASDIRSFKMTWLSCPAQSDKLDLTAVDKRAKTLRASPAINSPGAALVHLAKSADDLLHDIIYSVYHAFESRSFCFESIKLAEPIVHVADLIKSEAIQFRDCAASAVVQVQSIIPDLSSLPDIEPNFYDDRSSSWHKNADYAFKKISFPSFSGNRGDQLSELRWHKYQSDILHARTRCSQLSENQVVQHLMTSFDRTEQHFTIAQQAALRPDCTVRQWLETIRDFYFTSGQFRHNIERAWQSYNPEESADFNELMHHIKEYYRLIFLDYPHMPGKQSRLDFACILFTKLQKLMQQSSMSPLSSTLNMFMPLSQLLTKFNDELRPAMNENTERADVTATAFIEWTVTQLLQVRESANTVRRYNLDSTENRFDYARLRNKRKPTGPPPPPPPPNAKLQAAAASLHTPNNSGHSVQPTQPPPRARVGHIPDLKEMCHTTDEQALRTWVKGLRTLPNVTIDPDFLLALDREFEGNSSSLHVMLAHATDRLPPKVTATAMGCVQTMLRVYFLYAHKQCAICPPCQRSPHKGTHKLCECPTIQRIIPDRPRATFFMDAFNQTRQFTPLPVGYTSKHDKGKRDRYDPTRKDNGNQSKRARNETPHHIR